jgi:pimeloyl-ACP methyl ester carboxylesterase
MIRDTDNILTGSKKPILFDCFYTETLQQKPIVIYCHGYKGFKDWGAWDLVAEAFANAGFFFVKFNFSHNGGTMAQAIDFPDLESFAQNNYSTELEDVDRIISHLMTTEKYLAETDKDVISLIGHSRGGGIALIKAEEDPRISKVITWAGVSDYRSRFKEDSDGFKDWEKSGRFYVENGRTKQKMPHNWQFYTDFISNEARLTISRAAKSLHKPWLIIHGNADNAVLIEEGEALHRWNTQSSFEVIKGADHVFGTSHPWEHNTLPEHLKKVLEKSILFLK